MKVVLDIETDELNASVVNCIVAKNMDTNVYTVFDPSNMYSFKNWSKNIEQYIMHNGLSFDAPVLNRLLGTPTIGFIPDSQRMFDIHHSGNDSFDSVHPRELELGTASIASLIYLIDKYGL